ncbi:MAG: DUF5677 domain-containing protein [Methanocellales archaeon]|nr:DUF5677 domain-containing protein [Methanocellales archaeon]MDD3291736.1 DUF5677 domain-containing protein [Methanocellales archaeon]MDD5235086.1 DUF5677 domain-containing protein [Methanocellales archaeon]MDD5485224.1 DUF5677 domain-containing protein [Methanocellales archaeon]
MRNEQIRVNTEEEHKELLDDVFSGLELSEKLSSKIRFGEVSYSYESDLIDIFHEQLKMFHSIVCLTLKGNYTEGFILTRSVFESYFTFLLMLKGTKYKISYKIKTSTEKNKKDIYDKFVEDIKGAQARGEKLHILDIKPSGNDYKSIIVTYEGIFGVDNKSKLIPVYYFVFIEYDPQSAFINGIPPIRDGTYLPDIAQKSHEHYKRLYRDFIKFDKVREALKLNNLISVEEDNATQVHYNFLSNFTHITNEGLHKIFWQRRRNIGSYSVSIIDNLSELYFYDHYLSELCLLYVLKINQYYLRSLVDYFANRYEIKDLAKFEDYFAKLNRYYDYFWFIFEKHWKYDEWDYETIKASHQRKGIKPDEKIPYYRDPLQRLINLHRSTIEGTTGLVYESPFPRKNAKFG